MENRVGGVASRCDQEKQVERCELRHIRVENTALLGGGENRLSCAFGRCAVDAGKLESAELQYRRLCHLLIGIGEQCDGHERWWRNHDLREWSNSVSGVVLEHT